MKYEVGQGVLYRVSLHNREEPRFEFGIIIQVDPDVDKYPYRIIFASNDEDDDWYSSEGVKRMVDDYNHFMEGEYESAHSR